MQNVSTSDLCDAFEGELQVADPVFRNYGGVTDFHGRIVTLRVVKEFILIRDALQTPGTGCVLVVDGAAEMGVALLGDRLATTGVSNGWAGVILNGCIRDAAGISRLAIGVKALNTCPRRPGQGNTGQKDVEVAFAGVIFRPGEFVYADLDGLVVSAVAREVPPD